MVKRKLSGIIQMGKQRRNGTIGELFFISNDNTSYKISKNHNWNKLKSLSWESIDAWGTVYFEFPKTHPEVSAVFYIKRFAVKKDDCLDAIDLEVLKYDGAEKDILSNYIDRSRVVSMGIVD